MSTPQSPWVRATVLMPALGLCLCLLHLGLQGGPTVTPDARSYLAAARAEGPLVDATGALLTRWPPGYPWALSVLHAALRPLGVPIHTSRPLCCVGVLGLWGLFYSLAVLQAWCRRAEYHPASTTLCLATAAFSVPLWGVFSCALSEAVYIPVLLSWLYGLTEVLTLRPRSALQHKRWQAYRAHVLLTAACLPMVRYVGVVPLVLTTAALWHQRSIRHWLVLCYMPITAWCLRTYLLSGHACGARGVPIVGAATVAIDFLRATSQALPRPKPLAVLFLLGVLLLLWQRLKRGPLQVPQNDAVCMLILGHLLITALAALTMRIDPVSFRLLSPVYIPCLILVMDIVRVPRK